MNTSECLDGELALRQLPETIDSDKWGGGIKRCIDEDLVSGFLVSGPSDDESNLTGLHGIQPKVYRFVGVVHVVEVMHILEGHSKDAVASEINCRSVLWSGFDRLGDNLAAAWFLGESLAELFRGRKSILSRGKSSKDWITYRKATDAILRCLLRWGRFSERDVLMFLAGL